MGEEDIEEGGQVVEIAKFVEVKLGVNEDGGGIHVIVRDDESDAEKLTKLALRILREINGKREIKKEKRNPNEVV